MNSQGNPSASEPSAAATPEIEPLASDGQDEETACPDPEDPIGDADAGSSDGPPEAALGEPVEVPPDEDESADERLDGGEPPEHAEEEDPNSPSHGYPEPDERRRGEAQPGIWFSSEAIEAQYVTQIGQIVLAERQGRPELVAVGRATIDRVRKVFVGRESFERQAEKVRPGRQRVIVLHGEEHSGKLTAALELASRLVGEQDAKPTIFRFEGDPATGTGFDVFARGGSLRRGAYVLEDAFRRRLLTPSALLDPAGLPALLEAADAYLLCTSTTEPEDVAGGVVPIRVTIPDLRQVLDNHLAHHIESSLERPISHTVAETARAAWDRISPKLSYPAQIERLCWALADLDRDGGEEAVLQAAAGASRIGVDAARSLFRGLTPNQRLYALLLGLLPGVSRGVFEQVYHSAVHRLRKERVAGLRDPRELGLDDLLSDVRASEEQLENASEQLADSARHSGLFFSDRLQAKEVHRQIGNYLPLLGSIAPLFIERIEHHSEPRHWWYRRLFAEALGRLLAPRFEQELPLLDAMVRHRQTGVQIVVGNILGSAYRSAPELFPVIRGTLESWVGRDDPQHRFVAGASLWRLYDSARGRDPGSEPEHLDTIRGVVFDLLEKLVEVARDYPRGGHGDTEARRQARELGRLPGEVLNAWANGSLFAVRYALFMIARTDLAAVAEVMLRWLTDDRADFRRVARRVLEQLFADEADQAEAALRAADAGRVYELLGLWSQAVRLPGVTVAPEPWLRALAAWCRHPEGLELVRAGLVGFLREASLDRVRTVRLLMAEHWIDHEHPEVRRLARALIARAFVVEGIPVEPRTGRYGLLLVDGSLSAQRELIAWRVYALLATVLDTRSALLGSIRELPSDSIEAPRLLVRRVRNRPRLLMPFLVDREAAEASFVLVMAAGRVVDLRDVFDTPWGDRILVIGMAQAEQDLPEERESHALLLGREGDLERIDDFLTQRRLDALWRPGGAGDAEVIRGLTGCDPADPDAISRSLSELVVRADEGFGERDQGREAIASIPWLVTEHPTASVDLVVSWLESADPDVVAWGEAAARTVLRLLSAGEALPPVNRYSPLLSLLERLVENAGWSTLELLVWALRRALREDDWRERLLAPGDGGVPLVQWLDRIAERHGEALAELLREWRRPRRSRRPSEELSESDDEFAEIIAQSLARKRAGILPPLEEGRSYAFLVLGDDGGQPAVREVLERLTGRILQAATVRAPLLVWVVFRLGRRLPLALAPRSEGELELPRQERRSVPLLGPILDVHDPSVVQGVLLLQTAPLVDAQDLLAGRWADRLVSYPVLAELPADGLMRVPPGRIADDAPESTAREASEVVDRFLRFLEVEP